MRFDSPDDPRADALRRLVEEDYLDREDQDRERLHRHGPASVGIAPHARRCGSCSARFHAALNGCPLCGWGLAA